MISSGKLPQRRWTNTGKRYIHCMSTAIPTDLWRDKNGEPELSTTRKIILLVTMGTMDLIGGILYSMIGPFFPVEVTNN